jgi:PadR family transcriptional regulator PadR
MTGSILQNLAVNTLEAYNANPRGIMPAGSEVSVLGEVEKLVLLAILRLGEDAYAVPIRTLIGTAGIGVSRGTIYVTLERLERKGYVTSWFSEPQAVRGGKARRQFRLKPRGLAAVTVAKRAIDLLAEGTILAKPVGTKI